MNKENILLLDTEKNVLLAYRTILEEEGFQVSTAFNEDEALSKISQQNFAVVISEYYLKGKNTLNLVKQIAHSFPDTYVAIISNVPPTSEMYENAIKWLDGIEISRFKILLYSMWESH